MNGSLPSLTTLTSATNQMNKIKLLSLLLLVQLLLVGCISPYNSIEADEAMPQMLDDSSVGENNE